MKKVPGGTSSKSPKHFRTGDLRWTLCWLAILPLLCARAAIGAVAVVPSGNATVEGNTNVSDFLNSSSFRMQLVFDASQFSMIPPGASGRVDSIWFRPDGSSTTPGVQYVFGGGAVTASLTPIGPDGLSPIFANNIGANPVTIYSGALNLGGVYQSGDDPQSFSKNITATSPFWYMPSQGNLLLDIAGAGRQTFFPGSLDAQSTFGDPISRVFAPDGNSLTGTPDTLGLVIRIDFTVVPEPSVWLLTAVGMVSILFLRRKQAT